MRKKPEGTGFGGFFLTPSALKNPRACAPHCGAISVDQNGAVFPSCFLRLFATITSRLPLLRFLSLFAATLPLLFPFFAAEQLPGNEVRMTLGFREAQYQTRVRRQGSRDSVAIPVGDAALVGLRQAPR